MKHVKSLLEYFDSQELKTKDFDKEKFISDYQSVMNTILVKILANNEYLNEFDNKLIKNSIIFVYKNDKSSNVFKIKITKNENLYMLLTNDIDNIELSEDKLIKAIKTTVYNSFLRFKNNINNK